MASGQGEVEVGEPGDRGERGEVGPEQPAEVDERARDADGAQLVRGAPQPAVYGLGAEELERVVDLELGTVRRVLGRGCVEQVVHEHGRHHGVGGLLLGWR